MSTAIVSWPADLPWRMNADFVYTPGAEMVTEDTGGGLPLSHEADTPSVDFVTGSLDLTRAQLGSFETWWSAAAPTGLGRGRNFFWFPDQRYHLTPLLGEDGQPLLDDDDQPLLRTALWLCTLQSKPAQVYRAGHWWRLPLELWVWP